MFNLLAYKMENSPANLNLYNAPSKQSGYFQIVFVFSYQKVSRFSKVDLLSNFGVRVDKTKKRRKYENRVKEDSVNC